jgi:tRNA(Ile2)-agmatinylcytidine synthase
LTKTLFWTARNGFAVAASLLAFDDTDSPEGMCTTYLAPLLLRELNGYDLLGPPRLVRLNPNIPWKTRGNAAVCLSIGHGVGKGAVCGQVAGKQVLWYRRGRPADPGPLLEAAAHVLERVSKFECDNTNPGIAVSIRRPGPGFYWRAVRGVVPIRDAELELRTVGAVWRKYKSGRGIVGATAAMSWRPRDRTWEVIAYRRPSRFGKPREIDPESVITMDRATRRTFNNYDYENGHVAITPGSPCPILFGIRGDSRAELLRARTMIRGEMHDTWLLFMTNQGTEDHVAAKRIGSLAPRDSARVKATVSSAPTTIQGGHVILPISDGDGIDAAFYEPSRRFREVARGLLPGDRLTVIGSVRDSPRSLNVEKICVESLVKDLRKERNPVCDRCHKSMHSSGRGKGFVCKKCGAKASADKARFRAKPRMVRLGWHEPPVASRRHLHKPIRRMSRVELDSYKYGR